MGAQDKPLVRRRIFMQKFLCCPFILAFVFFIFALASLLAYITHLLFLRIRRLYAREMWLWHHNDLSHMVSFMTVFFLFRFVFSISGYQNMENV